MQRLLASMVTTTSYGTWPPGDLRGYVDDGMVLPANPRLLQHATSLMRADPVIFTAGQQRRMHEAIIEAAGRYDHRLLALSIESWHLHWLIDHRFDDAPSMVGRLKTAMRKALDIGRIWTEGYDVRYCFTLDDVRNRAAYIHRHAGVRDLPSPHGMVIE